MRVTFVRGVGLCAAYMRLMCGLIGDWAGEVL